MTETVIIEFVSSTEGLQPAEDKLAAIGKIDAKAAQVFKQTNTELKNRVSVLTAVGQQAQKVNTETGKMKGTISDLDKVTKSFTKNFMEGFEQGVIDTLKEAGVSSDQFAAAMKKGSADAGKSTKSLRAELSQMRQELVRMKLAGKEGTEEFKKMEAAAGQLDDAIRDVSTAVKNVGSDTAVLEGTVGIFTGIAGATSAATAAVALFGEESEELQEVLLRVNSLMAITQGLQSVANILQKESSAAKLADIIVTRAQTAAQAAFNFVVGTSTGLIKGLRLALATTGVGLLVIGLIELVSALQSTETELEDVNFELDLLRGKTAGAKEAIEDLTDIRIAEARRAGKAESDLVRLRGRATVETIKAIEEENKGLRARRDQLDITSEGYFVLNKAIEDNNKEIKKLNKEALIQSIELQTQLSEEQKKAAEEQARLAKEAEENARKLRLAAANDELALLERKLLAAEKGGQIEITLQKKIIAAKAAIDVEAEGLTANQKLLIQERALQDQLELQKEFNKKSSQEAIEALISRNNAELQALDITNSEKLRLTIENIINQSQIEVAAAEGNASKIKEINAKRDADIKAARLKLIDEVATYELELEDNKRGKLLRRAQQRADDEKNTLGDRLSAIDFIVNYELNKNGKLFDILNEKRSKKLISEKDYNLQYADLVDQQAQIVENGEKKKQDAIDKTTARTKAQNEQLLQNVLNVANVVVSVLAQVYDNQSARENNRIAEQKRRLQELREAGAISEKEEQKRLKLIEAQERANKNRQAQREKQIAVFQALLSIPVAVLKGLKDGGLPLAIIYGALAGVQAALVAARPVPKFRKGKKDSYEGFGEVGEAGTELIEKDGRMYVADKPTVIWLGKKDKVYNPAETKAMMKQQPTVNKSLMTVVNNHNGSSVNIDYEKLGKSVGKNIPQTILNITAEGMSHFVKQGNTMTEYLDKRRGWG